MCGIWAVFGTGGDIGCQCNEFHKLSHRGPDAFRVETVPGFTTSCLAFHHLSIVSTDPSAMQPIRTKQHPYVYLMCNGEIYNFKQLGKKFCFQFETESDSEVIVHLYAKGGIECAVEHLDGVFAFCLWDIHNRKVFLGRDTFGVRPSFRIATDAGFMAVSSEAKGLMNLLDDNGNALDTSKIEPFLPGHVETYSMDASGKVFLEKREHFHKIGTLPAYPTFNVPLGNNTKTNIKDLLTMAVRKRLMAERRIGCLLSGGLDSSLITALVVQLARDMGMVYKIQTFSVGMEGSTDLAAARKMAEYLDTEHHEIIFTPEEGVAAIEKVIYHLENYDTITVRGSVAMYLLSKYIKENTDTTVIFSGEGSDEITQGYIHFHKAPTPGEATQESLRLCNDLYLYDVLRADRATAAWGLEVRVPFLDHRFSHYYLTLPDEAKIPQNGVEKHLLRSAFSGLIPDEILWRPKEGFSDGVSSATKSWFQVLKDHIGECISDEDYKQSRDLYKQTPPNSKESLYYRRIFEKYYPNMGAWVPYFWIPKWLPGITDPSARTLAIYKQ